MNEEVAGQTNASDDFAAVMNKCTFVISARMQKRRNDQAVIIKPDLNHSCGCMLQPGTKMSVGASFVMAQALGLLKDVPNAAPVNLQGHMYVDAMVPTSLMLANYYSMKAHRTKK